MSNYEKIYSNTVKNIILNITIDFINNGKFPNDIIIDEGIEEITIKYRDWAIFRVYAVGLSQEELLAKMLNYIYYL